MENTELDTVEMPWRMPGAIRNQFHHLDRFVVVNLETMIAVEGHYSDTKALRAAAVLSAANAANDHTARYGVYPIPARLHNQPPSGWR